MSENLWDAFDDDSDDEEVVVNESSTTVKDDERSSQASTERQENKALRAKVQQCILFLTQQWVKSNPTITLSQRYVWTNSIICQSACHERGIKVVLASERHQHQGGNDKETINCKNLYSHMTDAAIIVISNDDNKEAENICMMDAQKFIVPGGNICLLFQEHDENNQQQELSNKINSLFHNDVWRLPFQQFGSTHHQSTNGIWMTSQKYACPINRLACPWLPTRRGISQNNKELEMVHSATVVRSAYEVRHMVPLSQQSKRQAVECLKRYGYVVLRQIMATTSKDDEAWGKAILQDFHQAASILLDRDNVNICNPHDSQNNPQAYRELSMREDLRFDLRDGPKLRLIRQQADGNYPTTSKQHSLSGNTILSHQELQQRLKSTTTNNSSPFPLEIYQIVFDAMNPQTTMSFARGNLGRFNFSSGILSHYHKMRINPLGGILSCPGAADQALHADTFHLYQVLSSSSKQKQEEECHVTLPPHYINAFCLGTGDPEQEWHNQCRTGSTPVGGTAFIHASHEMAFTSRLGEIQSVVSQPTLQENLVRPSLELGDILLFDCRILHFGLANSSKQKTERVLLYLNMTQEWFVDPKNWDQNQSIFSPS